MIDREKHKEETDLSLGMIGVEENLTFLLMVLKSAGKIDEDTYNLLVAAVQRARYDLEALL